MSIIPRSSVSGRSSSTSVSGLTPSPLPPLPATNIPQTQQDYWKHHQIDYSWRFPLPDHQPREYFAPPAYVDEAIRRRTPHRPGSIGVSVESWRTRDRMRTQCVAIVACLNIGVDPPDVVKPSPCARLECWIDPESMLPAKALKAIGGRLQLQYERWHEKAKYKTLLDTTAEELRKTLIGLRRVAIEERVLMHYNGHGVPKPTANGEIWVYNKSASDPTGPPTQYIPVSLYDLQTWMGGITAPSIYVFDSSHAGVIVDAFLHFLSQRREKMLAKIKAGTLKTPVHNVTAANNAGGANSDDASATNPAQATIDEAQLIASLSDPCRHILLAACSADEHLPLSPDLPADLFTACLTTPIKMALRWFVSRSQLNSHSNDIAPSRPSIANHVHPSNGPTTNRARLYEMIENLPGIKKPNNRKSPYGELNWIFTAITDSIAWNILPRDVFQKLFRQDLLVSSLFRNFLLAQRILASYNCKVISVPEIAPTHNHPLWSCWDLASDIALSQLERYEQHGTPFTPSTFFEDQLTAFEIWLDSPSNQAFGQRAGSTARPPPMQLPVVLQVLLSTDHRLRALQLLARFMDYGTWAINLALSVGIFPYVQKLLQSPSKELREVLVFIWAKIFALDRAVAPDLSKVEYATYFVQHLKYQGPSSGAASSPPTGGGTYRPLHSRSSSVAPSPLIRPTMSSTPATPFQSFAPTITTHSGTLTPHVSDGTHQLQQFPFKTFGGQSSAAIHAFAADVSPQQHRMERQSNPPPLDLPGPSDQPNGTFTNSTHSAHLQDHPSLFPPLVSHLSAHMHMRAQPLHDPASTRIADIEQSHPDEVADGGEDTFNAGTALPPTYPTLQPSPTMNPTRVPFALDLSAASTASPIQSPTHSGHGSGVVTGITSSRPSPVLGAVAFSPTSPMLSPVLKGDTPGFASQARFDERPGSAKGPRSATDALPDAHDMTRVAKDRLLTPSLQHRLSLFIIASIAHANPKGQQILMQSGLGSFIELVAPHLLFSTDHRIRLWSCFAIGKLWQGFGHAKTVATAEGIPEKIALLLMDPVPDVRAAALWTLGSFFGGKILPPSTLPGANSTISPTQTSRSHLMKQQARLDLEIHLGAAMATLVNDGSTMVRRELMIALAELVYFQQYLFLSIATAHPRNRESISLNGWYIWRAILRGCHDCSSQVQEVSLAIKGYLKGRAILNQSQLGRMIGSQLLTHRDGTFHSHETIEEDDMTGGDDEKQNDNGMSSSRNGSINSREPSPSSIRRESRTSVSRNHNSIAHIDADDASSVDESLVSERDVTTPNPTSSIGRPPQGPPMRHFTRFKMGHLRPGGGATPQTTLPPVNHMPTSGGASLAGQRRTLEKSTVLKSLESGGLPPDGEPVMSGAGTLDERAADPMWIVPKSRLYDDAYAALSEPMLLPSSGDSSTPMPTMSQIRETKWRYARSQALLSHARDLRQTHPVKSSYVEVASLNADWESTACVIFHPFEPMLLAADNHATIGVWNYSEGERGRERLNIFGNDNPPGTKITQLATINDSSVSLLLAGSDDGVVRIWRNAHQEGRQQLVTAWVANPQPEVFYSASTQPPPSPFIHQLDGIGATPTQSYQDQVALSGSAFTPQSRLAAGRLSVVGGGVPVITSMKHSASTPMLQSGVTPSSRSGSMISQSGSLLPSTQIGSYSQAQRSPSLKPSRSPSMTPSTTAAMNIPSYSLTSGVPITPQVTQRLSPSPSATTVTAPTATTTSVSSRRKQRPPLILEWQQQRGRLLATGNGLDHLRLWDVTQEQCVNEIPIFTADTLDHLSPSTSVVTAMTSNAAEMVWIGATDGSLRCFDLRLPPMERFAHTRPLRVYLVSSARLHRSSVHSVQLQRHGHDGGMVTHARLISASVGGDIALADIRMGQTTITPLECICVDSSVVRYHRSSHKDKTSTLDAFTIHDYAPICASGSHKPFIEIFDHAGTTLDTIKYHVGFLGSKVQPITSLAFHRYKLILAAGAIGPGISIYEGPPVKRG